MHLDLVDAGKIVLDGVLDRENVHLSPVQLGERAVQGGRLPGAGGACHEDDAVWLPDHVPDKGSRRRVRDELVQTGQGGVPVESPEMILNLLASGSWTFRGNTRSSFRMPSIR